MFAEKSMIIDVAPKNMRDGIGVRKWTDIIERSSGNWPILENSFYLGYMRSFYRAPAKNILEQVKSIPFNDPMQEQATKNGMK